MTEVRPIAFQTDLKRLLIVLAIVLSPICASRGKGAQAFFPLRDVRPGLHGVGRTVFYGQHIEEFQVEILGVLQNIGPKQSIILAKLSGGPLAETGVMQGMSGSPIYIDGKLLGAVALGFAFSKESIAGIQPIEQMIADTGLTQNTIASLHDDFRLAHIAKTWARLIEPPARSSFSLPSGNLSEILTPLSFSGFTPDTLQAFASDFRRLGFEPQQGVSGGSPKSPEFSGTVEPGSMISVQLVSGDMSISADGTVTYVDGKRIYAFGHRFLDGGSTDLPFARSKVLTLLPNVSTSFKISTPVEWVGTILSDRNTAIAGEIGRTPNLIPLTISVRPNSVHQYHVKIVHDRFLTPILTQTALFSAIDATERTVGAGTLQVQGRVEFDGNFPPLLIRDIFVSDNGLPQQASMNSVVPLGFVLGAGFSNLHVKDMSFELAPVETKREVQIAQIWTSAHEVHPGDSVKVTALFVGNNGAEVTRTAIYRVPIGAPIGPINFTISDANLLNFMDYAGLNGASFHTPEHMIQIVNRFRGSGAAYLRIWRSEPSFSISGPMPGGDLSDPPPSETLILSNPSASASTGPSLTATRGSDIDEIRLPVDGYVVGGSAKTVQVDITE